MWFQHWPRKCRNYDRCGRIIFGHRCSGFCSIECMIEYMDDPKYIRSANHGQAMNKLKDMGFLFLKI